MPYGFVPEIKEMGMKVRDEIDEIVATNTTNTTDPTKQTNNNEEMSNEITYSSCHFEGATSRSLIGQRSFPESSVRKPTTCCGLEPKLSDLKSGKRTR